MKPKFRWLWLAISLVALLFSLSCGGEEGRELLVVDYNILHGILNEDPAAEPYDRFPERIQLTAEALAELRPDVILLQEVFRGGPDYPDVLDILLGALGEEYTLVFGDITGAPINEGGIGQLTLTRLRVLSSENHFVGGVRSIHRVTVETEDGGTIDIYNTHLEGTGAIMEVGAQAPIDEIENVLAFIQETRAGTGPVILAGDFNAEPEDPSIQKLLDEEFIDVLAAGGDPTCEQAGDPGCTNSAIPLGEPGNRADRRIDYIFVLPGDEAAVDVQRAALFLNEPVDIGGGRLLWASDHIGVQAVVELGER